jgi:hypothetical protein
MLLAAALISAALVHPQVPAQAPAQAPPPAAPQTQAADNSAPQTAKGVRLAAAGVVRLIDYNAMDPEQRVNQVALDSRAVRPSPCSLWSAEYQPGWRAATPTWHEQFLAMTTPQHGGGPYYGATNGDRLLAAASAVVIGWALQAITSRVQIHVSNHKADRKQKKVEKVRAEIRAELAELERVNAAARAAARPGGPTTSPTR